MTTSSASSVSKVEFRPHRLSDQALAVLAPLVERLDDDWAVVRRAAFDALKTRGFPSRKEEDWQYTPLDALLAEDWVLPQDGEADVNAFRPPFDHVLIAFVDGRCVTDPQDLSVKGLHVRPLLAQADAALRDRWRLQARPEADPFQLLNLALMRDGMAIEVSGQVAETVVLLHVHTQPGVTAVRHRVTLKAHAQLTLVELHVSVGEAAGLVNPVIETELGEGAVLRHVKLQQLAGQAFHMGWHAVRQQGGSQLLSDTVQLGGRVSRHMTHTCLLNENAGSEVNSAALVRDQQVIDSRTFTDHASAHCFSRQNHRLVVADSGRGVFDGMIHVARGAQKTDGLMDNKNLLIGDRAKVDAKPRLEIYADDVKCSHGSATGQLDRDQLFYLRARGLDADTARRLITRAFLAEPLEGITHDALRGWLIGLLDEAVSTL
ncbi:Fe-S cluster assembly protein SufD [Sulfurivirga sp.]|uniref:Fe-S cluster assembly protein SufD n=1 Tax=Sulfurivirga sp. TaxID=2614236 RepID=UPI0025D7B353|nr:Fe-S cluster assembly protein SufD [Sulfurivirga sp.]